MIVLEIEPMDLGNEVRATALELLDGPDGEPALGAEAADAWSKIVPAIAGKEPWALDFFGKTERVRVFCESRGMRHREASRNLLVVTPEKALSSKELFERFSQETVGIRAGSRVELSDSVLEGELTQSGFDAYQSRYEQYFFCAICDLANGSLVVLSANLWATETARRVRSALVDAGIQVQIAH